MHTDVPQSHWSPRAVLVTSAIAAAVAVVYIYLRYLDPRPEFLLASQVVYLAPIMLAVLLALIAGMRCRPRTHGRRAWHLIALADLCLFVSEAAYSAQVLWGGRVSGAVGSVADVANGLALVIFFVLVALVARIDRLGWSQAARFVLDSLALSVLAFILVFRLAVVVLDSTGHSVPVSDAVRLAVYPTFGLLLIVSTVLVAVAARSRSSSSGGLIGVATISLGVGTIMWPFWDLADVSGAAQMLHAVGPTAFLIAYVFLAGAAASKLTAGDRDIRVMSPTIRTGWTWMSIASSTVVFVSVVIMSAAAIVMPERSAESAVYLSGVVIASLCMAGRTVLTSAELDGLRTVVRTDDVTGASSRDHLMQRMDELCVYARRFGERFALLALDLDDFAEYNRRFGRQAGDEALAAVATSLTEEFGSESLFRLGDDEFALVFPAHRGPDLDAACFRAVSIVACIPARRPLSASAGYAVCPDHGRAPTKLLARAQAAETWARNRGPGALAVYDESVMVAKGDISSISFKPVGQDMVRALSAAMDARDPANHRHAQNVAALSVLLGRGLGLDEATVSDLRVAALLHDVGKLALPDDMLNARTLTVRQRISAQEHADLGGRLVEALGVPSIVSSVRCHHERWDGRGYPDQLAGEAIPLQARIIALADAFDGMTTGKRYGAPMSKGAALQEIDLGMGARFDPRLAETFIAVVGATDALGWTDGWTAA